MKKLYLVIILFIPFSLLSQSLSPESIFSATDSKTKAGYASISWTLGSNQISTYSKTGYAVITEGFIQTRLTITSVDNLENERNIQIKFYPNPVKDLLQVEINPQNRDRLKLDLYSIDGKLILSRELGNHDKKTEIDFSGYQKGLYLLKASSVDQAFSQSYKILYQN